MQRLYVLFIISFLSSASAFAGKISYNRDETLNVNYTYRPPLQNNFEIKDDKQKSLSKLKTQTMHWQLQDEFVRNWNLESSGMYATPEKDQRNILFKSVSRYSERRAKEYYREKRNKGDNSDLLVNGATVNGKGSDYYFSYHTVVLKGKARLDFNNPFLELYSQYSFSGKDEMVASRKFNDFAMRTSFIYAPLRDRTTMIVEKYLNENWTTRISNINFVENKIELLYTSSFF